MTSSQSPSPWQGYINQLTYGLDLKAGGSAEAVTELADRLIEQRSFLHPVQSYHSAARAALASAEPTADRADDDTVIRDVLRRLLRELDARRPWPVPAYRIISAPATAVAAAPVIGIIPLSRVAVSERVNGLFEPRHMSAEHQADVVEMQLRSGHTVTLVAPESFTTPGVVVRAHGDPPMIAQALRELTGLEMEL